MKHQTTSVQSPRQRIQELGTTLRAALIAVLAEVGGPNVRPVVLARTLKLDDSLSARMLRSVRASDALSALRELPAPQGLRLFLEAAAKCGVSSEIRGPAERAVNSLEEMLNELPLGRTSLDTAIDGWLPSGRARAERASKQAVYKAFSQTLGYTVDTLCFATAIQPSAAGDFCDAMNFVALEGIRRLREGAPIMLLGHTKNSVRPSTPGHPGMPPRIAETLDGEREVTDARKFLLPDVGEGADLPIRLIDRANHMRVVLESSTPPLNVPVTAAIGQVSRSEFRRYQAGDTKTEAFICTPKIPVRVSIMDLFLHEDVYPSFVPNVVARMDGITDNPQARDDEVLETDRIELDVELVRLGWGLERIGVKERGRDEPALRSAFRRVGWNASRFRAYRCYVRHPFPFVSMTTWFDLPPGP